MEAAARKGLGRGCTAKMNDRGELLLLRLVGGPVWSACENRRNLAVQKHRCELDSVARHDASIKPIEPAAVLHDSVGAATTASRSPGHVGTCRATAAALRRLCRRDRCSGSATGGECDPALRSEDREIRLIPTARPLCRGAAARGPQGRKSGVPNRVRQALCAEDRVKHASGEYRGAK